MFGKKLLLVGLLYLSIAEVDAQQKRQWGHISGGLESNNALYLKDTVLSRQSPEHRFGSNTYLKLNYTLGHFSAGLQYEAYLPPLVGYSKKLDGNELVQGFVKYSGEKTEALLGNFYEQFGSGLIFRSFEDRSLGINSSVLGAMVRYRPTSYLSVKAMGGKPRSYLSYSSTLLYGADGDLSVTDLLKTTQDLSLKIGGSYLHQQVEKGVMGSYPPSVDAYAGRITLALENFTLSTEYVDRSKAQVFSLSQGYSSRTGSAFLINTGYDSNGMGISASFRRLENSATRLENTITDDPLFVSYIPALTKQHKYALANINPYSAQANGEIGGQVDLYWDLPHSLLGGQHPEKISVNFSTYYDLREKLPDEYSFWGFGRNLLYQDLNVEVEKRWSKKLKSNLMLMHQKIARSIAESYGLGCVTSQVVAADMQYQLTRNQSVRAELQHCWSDGHDGEWLFALAEYGVAPSWLFYASDMYSYGAAKELHYYSVGGSFSKGSFRVATAYGRNRAGNQCSGGICRYMPAFSGITLSLTATF